MNWRNCFHIEAPVGLINDPNGLMKIKDDYYLYFQWNPTGCTHKNKHWALLKTEDFIHYSKIEKALFPDELIDKDGCYSGCGILFEEKPYLLYTGNVKNDGIRCPYQILYDVEKKKKIPVVVDSHKGYTGHYRDPFYLKGQDHLFVVGAQRNDLSGCLCMYKSKDFFNWEFKGEVKFDNHDGYMWECPNLLRYDTNDVLLYCQQNDEPMDNMNKDFVIYHIGQYNEENNGYIASSQGLMDYGFDYYAPQVFDDGQRKILLAWAGVGSTLDVIPTVQQGYIYSLTMPREVKLVDGVLYQKPIDEMYQYLDQDLVQTLHEGHMEADYEDTLYLQVNQISKEMAFDFSYGEEGVKVHLNGNTLHVDRNTLCVGPKGERTLSFEDVIEDIEIFVDRSLMEIYMNQGKYVFTLSFFPQTSKGKLQMTSCENVTCKSMKGMVYDEQ